MKCHQRIIREAAAANPEPDEHLKKEAAASLANASVREIPNSLAKAVLIKYEWLKNMGQTRWSIGLIFKHPVTGVEYLGGVACFGSTAGSNVAASICGKEHAHEACTLVRGTCLPWADRKVESHNKVHTGAAASFLINRACDLMTAKGKHCFIAYSDENAGEVGTVYQSSNWYYVGKGGTDMVQHRADGRIIGSKIIATKVKSRAGLPDRKRGATIADVDAWAQRMRDEGKSVKGKGFHQYVQTRSRAEAKKELVAANGEFVPTTPKHRYVHFAGDRRKLRELREALLLTPLPYPKRDTG
jgi:hypothetical protein